MKLIVPFITFVLLTVTFAGAQCQDCGGGYAMAGGCNNGQGCFGGYNTRSCDYASSLWAGYCDGGSPCGSACGGGCGGGRGGQLRGMLTRLQGMTGGGSACGGSDCSCDSGCGCGSGSGFGAYATRMSPLTGGCGSGACSGGNQWWYGYGQPVRSRSCGGRQGCQASGGSCGLASGGCGSGGSCGRHSHCGQSRSGLLSRLFGGGQSSSWLGGSPLDCMATGVAFPETCMNCDFDQCLNCGQMAMPDHVPSTTTTPAAGCVGGAATQTYSPPSAVVGDGGARVQTQGEAYTPADEGPFSGSVQNQGTTGSAPQAEYGGTEYDAADTYEADVEQLPKSNNQKKDKDEA